MIIKRLREQGLITSRSIRTGRSTVSILALARSSTITPSPPKSEDQELGAPNDEHRELSDPAYCQEFFEHWGIDQEYIDLLQDRTILDISDARSEDLIALGITPEIAMEIIFRAEELRRELVNS